MTCESKSNYTVFSTSLIEKHPSVNPSSLCARGGGSGWVEPSPKFLKRRSLTVRRELPKKGGVLGQFADLREGAWQKREGHCFWGGLGVGDNPMYTMNLAITFNCDFKLLMPMPSLLISNKKKVLSCNWLATNNNFWCCQEIKM